MMNLVVLVMVFSFLRSAFVRDRSWKRKLSRLTGSAIMFAAFAAYLHRTESLRSLPAASGRIRFERPFYLLPLAHPFAAIVLALLGFGICYSVDHFPKKDPNWEEPREAFSNPWEQTERH